MVCGLLALVAAGLVVVLYKGFGRDPHEVPFMMEGKPAPNFTLRRLDTGETITLNQLKGRPVVLNFWASWCGPCKDEQPLLDWGARTLADRAQFFGVIFEDTDENAREYLRTGPASALTQLLDTRSQTAVDYGVSGVPETYFIDANGIIRGKVVGPILDDRLLVARVDALSQPLEARK